MPSLKYIYLKLNLRVFLAGSTVDMITCKSESDNNDDWAVFPYHDCRADQECI